LFLRRLRSFASLSSGDRALALRAILWLGVMRVVLSRLPFKRVRRFIDHRRTEVDGQATAREIRRAMSRAERTLPGATCLARSLAAEVLLRASGLDSRLSIGVADAGTAEVPLDAHAWIESEGLVVAGDNEDIERYTVLLTFRSPA